MQMEVKLDEDIRSLAECGQELIDNIRSQLGN